MKLNEPIEIVNSYGKAFIEYDELADEEKYILDPLISIHWLQCEKQYLIYSPNNYFNEKQFDNYDLALKYLLKSLKD